MEEQVETMKAPQPPRPAGMTKNLWGRCTTPGPAGPLTSSKYSGLAAAVAAELMIGFWFGIGAILAIKMVNNLEELIRR